MKNYLDEIFAKQWISIKFCDYHSYARVSDGYQDFVTMPLSVIDICAPVRALRIKPYTKPFVIENRDKYYKKFK